MAGHAAQLRDCPAFDYNTGHDVFLASAFGSPETRYAGGGGGKYMVLLPGGRRQPASVLLRWEWQKRILVPLDHLGGGFNRRNPARSVTRSLGPLRQRERHVDFLKACVVRRQRFEAVTGGIGGATRRAYHQNLGTRQLPGRFAVWFTGSVDDDGFAVSIVDADARELWPHGQYQYYAVDPTVIFEGVLFQRDFRFREHIREGKWTSSTSQECEAGLQDDIKHARAVTNYAR